MYELRVESLKARVESLKAWVEIQMCECKSTSYEFKSTSSGDILLFYVSTTPCYGFSSKLSE